MFLNHIIIFFSFICQVLHGIAVSGGEIDIPLIGLGTAGLQDKTQEIVIKALQSGVRLIDTAQADEWYNEYEVGQSTSKFVAENNISDNEIILVTKIHPRSFSYDSMNEKLLQSFDRLNRSQIDVVLLHAPHCWPGHCTAEQEAVGWRVGWRNLEKLKIVHGIRHIGVSNFGADLLKELLSMANSKVSVVQNWMDPFHQDNEVRVLAASHHIRYMAFSSFGTQWTNGKRFRRYNPVLNLSSRYNENLALRRVAERHGVTIPTVVIAWAMHLGTTIIPRSGSLEHLADNFGFVQRGEQQPVQLSDEDLREIASLDGLLGDPWD